MSSICCAVETVDAQEKFCEFHQNIEFSAHLVIVSSIGGTLATVVAQTQFHG